jgi:hypothetical protein
MYDAVTTVRAAMKGVGGRVARTTPGVARRQVKTTGTLPGLLPGIERRILGIMRNTGQLRNTDAHDAVRAAWVRVTPWG